VLGMAAIFTYGFEQAEENFKAAGIPLYTLSNYHYLLQEALQAGTISEDHLVSLKSWRVDPAGWGK
jgi:orotate phosphoribosyltransferase